jgi:nitrite reductase (NADH) small subunit
VIDTGTDHMENWTRVCRLDEIVPNTGVCALASGRQVAIFRLDDDTLYALDNHDPFSRVNVLSRGIVGEVEGELVVASPVYKQHFSLASGACLEDAAIRVAVFPVRLEDGHVWVSVNADPVA